MDNEEALRPSDASTDLVAHFREGIGAARHRSPAGTHALALTAFAGDDTSRPGIQARATVEFRLADSENSIRRGGPRLRRPLFQVSSPSDATRAQNPPLVPCGD